MRFNSSPESANPKSESASALDSAEKKSQLKFTLQGQDILSSPRQYSADIQRVFPSLESRKTDPRLSLPSELLLLYGDPALLNARPNQAGDDKTGKSVKSSDISCLPGSSSSSTAEPSRAAYNANDSTSSARAGGARGAADAIEPLSPWLNPAAVPLSPNLNDVPPSRNLSDVPLSPNLSDVPPSRNLSDVPLSPNPSDVSPSPNSNEAPPNPYFRFGPVAADGPRDASPVRFDDAGYSTDIYYPDAKIRHIERDPQTHEVNAIVTSNAEGTSRLVKQNGSWFLDVQGMQLAFPGKVEVAKDGTVSMQTSEKGVWRIEQPDGTIREEKENADGARVGYDSNHQINKITRADGSSFQLVNGNTMLEAHPAGKTVTWTNNDGMWTSSDDGGKPRKNMLLHDNASLTFDDTAGLKHTINGRGFETLEGAGFGTIVSDAAGRPTEVDNADAKKARKYDYFDDKSYDIKSVNIIDKQTNKEVVYTRESKSSNQWRTSDGQVWSGEIKVSPDGVHSIKAANQYSNDNSSSKWTSYYPDGRQTSDSIGADGSRASYDSQNNLVSFRGADGQRIDRLKVNGKDTLTVYDPKLGETVNWSKENNGVWASDSPRFKDGRADLNFNTNGELSFTNDKGAKVQEHRDGSKQVSTKDGTRLDYDKDNQIVKAVRGNLERTFTRDASGIAVVKDRNLTTKEERTIFERRPPGEENRSNIFISANGDLSYQNPDGTASIERSSMIHVDLDRDGDITRVVSPQGTRTYEYLGEGSQKTVASVKDLRMTDKGAKSETWTRVANPDGSLSNEFRSLDDKGKPRPSRYSITPCADGEFEYRLATDKPNDKAHVGKIGGDKAEGGFSGNVDDARERLQELMESHLDAPHKARFTAMLAAFESRAGERVQAETAGGKAAEKSQGEWDQKVTRTYDYLSQMMQSNSPNAVYDLDSRSKLVETAIYSMAWPAKADDQGNWGCCWQISGVFLGVIQHPDKMAKMLDQLSCSGTFTDVNGHTWTPPRSLIQLSDQGSSWTIENNGDTRRSPCSEIWTSVAAYLSNNGNRFDRGSGGGTMEESMHAMKLITGDTWRDTTQSAMTSSRYKQDLLLKGGVVLDSPGHMYLGTLQKNRGQWQIISSLQHGDYGREVNGVVRNLKDWVVDRVRTRYTPDLPKVAGLNDQPIGSNRRRNQYSQTRYS